MSAGLGMPSLLLAGITLLVAPVAAQPGIAQSDRKGAPELVTSGEYPAVRHVVAHAHRMTWFGCFGYLYFSRDKVRYEVVHPQRSKEHSFELPRSALKRGVDFALTDAAEMRLRTAGADDALLLAITKGKK